MMRIMILVNRSRLVNPKFEAPHLPPGKNDLISIVRDLFSSKAALWTDGAIKNRTCNKLTGDRTKILMLTMPFICRDLAYEEV